MTPDNANIKNTPPSVAEDEIDLIDLAKTLWAGRKIMIKTTLIFMVLGLFIALFSEKEYTASTSMIPQSADGGMELGGGLGGLAAMAGINLGGAGVGSAIPPSLYPKIIESVPFQKEMMKTLLTIEGQGEKVTFQEYYLEIANLGLLGYIKKYTVGLPGIIIGAVKGKVSTPISDQSSDDLLTISKDEKILMDLLLSQLSLEVNDKDGSVSIYAYMPEARPAAEMVKQALYLLQNAITKFKIQKAKDQLTFITERYAEKEVVFIETQEKLARFRDQNRNMRTSMAQSQMERLQSEFSIASSVFSELAKQLETQKIQVKEDTPVFTIIDPVSVPLDKSKPKRAMILIVWTFLGGIIGVGMVFGKEFLGSIRKQWHA